MCAFLSGETMKRSQLLLVVAAFWAGVLAVRLNRENPPQQRTQPASAPVSASGDNPCA